MLERQLREAVDEADSIKAKPYGDDGWGPWQTNVGDFIGRAFGPESPQANSFHWAGGIADGPDRQNFFNEQALSAGTD